VNNSEFSSLNLSSALQDNLASLGYLQMTPIQAQSLPLVLDGKDLIAKAKTGSGKTAAFGLGLLAKLDVNRLAVQALVLCPTRELADQVATEIRRLARTLPNAEHVEFRFMIDRKYAQRTFYAIRMTECGLFSYRLCNTGYCIVKYFLKISSSVNKVLSKCFCRIPVVVTYKLLISVC
jgi:tRNA(Met) C34 N-acetyltransferase TmcA